MFKKSYKELSTSSTMLNHTQFKPLDSFCFPDSFNKTYDSKIYRRVTFGVSLYKRLEKVVGLKKEAKGKMRRKLKLMIEADEREYYNDDEDDDSDHEEEEGHDNEVDDASTSCESIKKCNDSIVPSGPKVDATDVKISSDVDNDDCGSAFGIMRVFCDSELHAPWTGY